MINGETNTFKVSMQVAILNNSSQASSTFSNESSTVLSAECSNFNSGVSLINSYISKKINLSHCKAIIISEELAASGLSDITYTLVNNVEIRPDCNIVVSKCNASDYLEYASPIFESNPANYYELILNSAEYSGYVANLTLSDFYSSILSKSSQASAILGGINTTETRVQTPDSDNALDGNYKAGQTPIESKNSIENIGTAVFSGDKLVGELNNIETLCYLIITNDLKSATLTVPNPFDFYTNISVYISLNKKTKNKVSFINGFPYIECSVYVVGDISSLDNSINLSDPYYIDVLNSYVNTYLKDSITSYLYKTAKEYKSDISGFGKYVLPYYATWNDWVDSDWLNNYQNAFFNVEVDTNLQSGYLFNKF